MMRTERTEREVEMQHAQLRSDIRTAWALLAGFAAWLFGLAVLVSLPGCPIRVDPPTEEVCPSRANCGLCASEAVCVWCPASSACIGRSSEACEPATVVSVPEMCDVPEESR